MEKTALSAALEDLASQALDTAKRAGADKADVLMAESVDATATCRLGKQEALERSESSGLGLRVWVGDRQAMVSTSDLRPEKLGILAERAVAMAKVATPDAYSTLADASLLAKEWPELDLFDGEEPSAADLLETTLKAEAAGRDVAGITNSEGADASFSSNRVFLATSEGFAGGYRISSHALSVTLLAGEKDGMERDYDYSVARHRVDLADAESIGRKAAELTLSRIGSRKIASTSVPIVFDPRIGKNLLGTLVGAISGASVSRKTTFLLEQLGKEVFAANINVIDDPLVKRGLGSHPFDGEGVRVKKQAIIENGVLKTWLLDTRTAKQLGMQTTGHASRGLSSPPSPTCSNLYMQNGSITRDALLAQVHTGLYVTDVFGMGVNIITGDYSQGAAGFWIENGKISYPVSEITIAGRLPEMFKAIQPANDLTMRYSINTPTFAIGGMTIAGS